MNPRLHTACWLFLYLALPALAALPPDVQITRDPVTGLTAEAALRMGSDKFVGLYPPMPSVIMEIYRDSVLISIHNRHIPLDDNVILSHGK